MPKATVNTNSERKDLKSLPGAFVELRRLSFGEKAERTDMAMRLAIEGDGKTQKGTVEMSSKDIAVFELAKCVTDHNLFMDDEEKVKMNLTNPQHVAALDPRVGEEISLLIDQMNNFDAEELADLGNESSSQS